jgi:ABC-type branched-subunit amino acid transport system substrate-binding protein
VSPIPALGYDATLLLLEGVRTGGQSRAALRSALGRVRELEGATGIFSVLAGQVVRRTQVVRLDHGITIPIG